MPEGTPPPACPDCGEAALPLMFGLPAPEARRAAADGRLALGGCFAWGDGRDPLWECPGCGRRWNDRTWEYDTWLLLLERVLGYGPRCPRCEYPSRLLVYRHAEAAFRDAIEAGDADVSDGPAPPGLDAQQRCMACGWTWTAD